jgi:hypothetical protein
MQTGQERLVRLAAKGATLQAVAANARRARRSRESRDRWLAAGRARSRAIQWLRDAHR